MSSDACDPFAPRPVAPEVFIGPDGLSAFLRGQMDQAASELLLMMYQLTTADAVDGLVAAHQRGVSVRVLLDGQQAENDGALAALEAAGVPVRAAPPDQSHAHAKVMLIDGERALVMSANMNSYSMATERNFGVVDRDPDDLTDLRAIFDRDWAGSGEVDLACTRLVVAPENARARLLQLIGGAEAQLDLAVMYATDPEIRFAIRSRIEAGVPTRVLLAHPEWIDSNVDTAAELSEAGAEVRYLYALELHAKLVLTERAAFVGSENLSTNALDNNREIGLFVAEPAPLTAIGAQFEQDWASGVAP